MFYILEEDWEALPSEEHVANLVNPPADEMITFSPRLHRGENVAKDYGSFTFALIPEYQPPDCIINNGNLPIYSERLINILKAEGVKFNTIPVFFQTKYAMSPIKLDYFLLNLVEVVPCVDREKSKLKVGKAEIVLLDEYVRLNCPYMFALAGRFCLVNQKFADRLRDEQITGFRTYDINLYR